MLEPVLKDSAKAYDMQRIGLSIGVVDCTNEKTICEQHQVSAYPTLK